MDRFNYDPKTRRQKRDYLYLLDQANLMSVSDDVMIPARGKCALDDDGDGGEESDESQILSILL